MYTRLLTLGTLAVIFFGGWFSFLSANQKEVVKPGELPKEVLDLSGTYTGSWTMFGVNEKGEVAKRMAWTDVIKAGKPESKDGRGFVITTDEMKFEGGQIPPVVVPGKEGYFLKQDGSVGDYFIETAGQSYRMVKVGDNVWSYTTSAASPELVRLGFPSDATGQHVLVKVLTKEQGTETHRISRVTTVNWKDKEGQERWLQFVSLQGFHKRQP